MAYGLMFFQGGPAMENPNKLIIPILFAAAAFLLSTLWPSWVTAENAPASGSRAQPGLSLLHRGPTPSGYPKHAPVVTGSKTWPKKAAKAVSQPKSTRTEALPAALPYQSVRQGQPGMTYEGHVPAQVCEATASCPPIGPWTGPGWLPQPPPPPAPPPSSCPQCDWPWYRACAPLPGPQMTPQTWQAPGGTDQGQTAGQSSPREPSPGWSRPAGTGSAQILPIPIRPTIPPAPPVVGSSPPAPAPAPVGSASGWPRWLKAPYAMVSSLLSAPSR
jgi:hypothetical protein